MLVRLLVFLSILFSVQPITAQENREEKIRKVISMPTIGLQFGIVYDSKDGITLQGETKPPKKVRIAHLENQLTGTPKDARLLLKLSNLYEDKHKGKQIASKALEFAQQQLKRHPQKAESWILLADCQAGLNQYDRAEKTFQQAVEKFPNEPECWIGFGQFLGGRSITAYFGGNQNHDFSMNALLSLAMQRRVNPEDKIRGDKLRTRAKACFDKAVEVAPNQAKPYTNRAAYRLFHDVLMATMIGVGEKKKAPPNLKKYMFSPDLIPDLQKAAELSPNDPRTVGIAALFELFSVHFSETGLEKGLPEKTKKSLIRAMTQLEAIARQNKKATRADAFYLQALFHMFTTQDTARCETLLRQAVKADPTHNQSWDLLMSVFYLAKELEKQVEVSEARLKHQDTPHTRFLAAVANFSVKKYDRTEIHLNAGLKQDPENVINLMGLAAVLITRSDQPGNMARLKPLMKRIETLMAKNDDYIEFTIQFEGQRAAYLALTGNADEARKILRSLVKDDSDNVEAKALLDALRP